MQFSETDLDTMLEATGEPVAVQLNGVTVKTITAKFRKDFADVSHYEMTGGILKPSLTCKTSDLTNITSSHTFFIRNTEYKLDGKPEEKPSGLTLVKLGLKK